MNPMTLVAIGIAVAFLGYLMYQSTFHPRRYCRYNKEKGWHPHGCRCGCQRRMHPAM